MTAKLRKRYRHWRTTKEALETANTVFAAAVGRRAPERQLLALAHDVARLQEEERDCYQALPRHLVLQRLIRSSTWPSPLA
jgi:hypothetical protein